MKLLVMSDNHGNYLKVDELINLWRDKVDFIFHLGDSEFPADDPIWDKVDAVVTGNMDYDRGYRQEILVPTPVGNVFITHGHLDGVNRGNQDIFDKGKALGAAFIFHGHTHRLYAEYRDGILLLNPGSLSQSRGERCERTFAVIDVKETQMDVQFYEDNNQPISDLHYTFQK